MMSAYVPKSTIAPPRLDTDSSTSTLEHLGTTLSWFVIKITSFSSKPRRMHCSNSSFPTSASNADNGSSRTKATPRGQPR